MVDLGTTNVLLGIMAVVSVLEAIALIAGGVLAYRLYTEAMATVRDLERRRIDPLVAQVNEILVDVKGITARVNQQTERVDVALRGTIERVDETAGRVKSSVMDKADRVAGVVRGVRAVIESLLRAGQGEPPSAPAAGRL
jgi:hypothetical protein